MPTYSTPQQVSITIANPIDAVIHYTLDGSTPTAASAVYDPLNPLLISTTTTIKAIGIRSGYTNSNVVTVVIEIILNTVYYGYSPLTDLSEAQIIAITNAPGTSTLTPSDCFGTYAFGSGSTPSDYFYFWWPDTFSAPSSGNGFEVTASGFPAPMAGVAEGYTTATGNGWFHKPKTVNTVTGKLHRTLYAPGNGTTQSVTVQ